MTDGTHAEDGWEGLLAGLRDGDEQACAAFYHRYGPLLERLADRNLESGMKRRVDGDEVAHSACRTFLRRVQDGAFELSGRDDLWNLLSAIAVAKLRKKVRFHGAGKRGVDREVRPAGADDGVDPADRAAALDAAPDAAVEVMDAIQGLLDQLDVEERTLVCLKLEQRTDVEVAEALGCAERTVRRIRQRVQERLGLMLGEA